jgi:hypothetical protein
MRGRSVGLSHFPYEGDSTDTERFKAFRPLNSGNWLLHGHVHSAWKLRDLQINVGLDAWGLAPVVETRLTAVMDARVAVNSAAPELIEFMRRYGFFDAWVLLVARDVEGTSLGDLAADLVEYVYRANDAPENDGINSLIAERIPNGSDHFQALNLALASRRQLNVRRI